MNITSYLNNQEFLTLFHISDIHIRNDEQRFQEFRLVFENLFLKIKTHLKYHKNTSLIIVTGDILDKGLYMSAHAVQLLKLFVDGLTKLAKTIIIPGNHDDKKEVGNSTLDSLSAIFAHHKNESLYYLKHSGIYNFGTNLVFGHTSVIDKKLITAEMIQNKERHKIAIFHGMVDAKTKDSEGGFLLRDCDFSVNHFKGYSKVLLGDVHKKQKIGNGNIWYAGSLVQKSFGECRRLHGGLLVWDVKSNTDPEFIKIENLYSYVTLKVNKGKITGEATAPTGSLHLKEYLTFIPDSLTQYSNIRLRCDTDTTRENVIDIFKNLNNYTNVLTENVVWQDNQQIIESDTSQNENNLLTEYLKIHFPDDIDSLTQLDITFKKKSDIKDNCLSISGRWSPTYLEWENMYNYGKKYHLDFTSLPKDIISICGDNGSGKTKIVDILLLAIYGIQVGGISEDIKQRITYGKKNAHTSVIIKNNNDLYKITRNFKKNGNKYITLMEIFKNNICISGSSKKSNEYFIKKNFGTLSDLCDTHVAKQSQHQNFINKNTKLRLKLLKKMFGTDIYEDISLEISKQITSEKSHLKLMEKTIQDIVLHDTNILQDEINTLKRLSNTYTHQQTQLLEKQRLHDSLLIEIKCLNQNTTKIKNQIKKLAKQLVQTPFQNETINQKIKHNIKHIDNLNTHLKTKSNLVETLCRKVTDIDISVTNKINTLKKQLHQNNQILTQLHNTLQLTTRDNNSLTDNINQTQSKLTDISLQLDNITLQPHNWKYHTRKEYLTQLTQIGNLTQLLDTFKKLKKPDILNDIPIDFSQLQHDYRHYQSQLTLKNKTQSEIDTFHSQITLFKKQLDSDNFNYNINCECCLHNQNINNIPQTKHNLEKLQNKTHSLQHTLSQLNLYLAKHDSLTLQYQNSLDYTNYQNQSITLQKHINQYQQLATEMESFTSNQDKRQLQQTLLTKQNTLNQSLAKLVQQRLAKQTLLDKTETQIKTNETHTVKLILSLEKADSEIIQLAKNKDYELQIQLIKQDIQKIHTQINTLSDTNKSFLDMKNNNLANQQILENISQTKQELSQLETESTRQQTRLQQLNFQTNSLTEIQTQITLTQQNICKKSLQLENATQNRNTHQKYTQQYNTTHSKLTLHKKYLTLTRDFPNYSNLTYLRKLNTVINGFLWNMTHFTIEITLPTIDTIQFKKKTGNNLVAIEECSGFEKFTISLAIRLALAKINPLPTLDGLIIDEGFGVFDTHNLKKLPNILSPLKGLFRHIFIITHIEHLQSELPYKIRIKKDSQSLPLIQIC
jgi:DNA repair protein SbcC/Rad50